MAIRRAGSPPRPTASPAWATARWTRPCSGWTPCTASCKPRSPTSTRAEPLLMVRRLRLDAELVRRQLARSREQAGELIEAGRVQVRGTVATKAATGVEQDTPIRVLADADDPGYASRGGHKLAGALDEF